MGSKTIDFIMEGVVDGDLIVAVVVDGICEQLESNAMARAVVVTSVSP